MGGFFMRRLDLYKNDFLSSSKSSLRSKRGAIRRLSSIVMAGLLVASTALVPVGGVFANESNNLETAKIVAFPGAEGGGMYATGGRGYDVYVVTNLEDYGLGETPIPGSLRYGIETATDGCMIVFNIGGTIELKQTLSFRDKKNITIAGQTAPGDGITLSGYETNISNSENLIIRFVHFRTGAKNVYTAGDSMDALWGRDNKTFIIDHCSFSWNTDETLSTYRGADGTVQWCIISESLTVSGHSKGRHGYGGIFGGDNVVFQNNLIANHTSRNPRIGGGTMTDPTKVYSMATVQLSNNYLYNWGYYSCYGGGYAQTNYINNYFKTGPGTRDAAKNTILNYGEKKKPGSVYYSGNVFEGNEDVTNDNSKGFKFEGASEGNTVTTVADTAFESAAFNQITLRDATTASNLVLNQAGVTYPKRDAIDARVVAEVENGTGAYINTEDEVGGYATKTISREEAFDKDLDGISDEWELAHGLNPSDSTDSKKIAPSGYSYIEEYANELVSDVIKEDYKALNPDLSIDLANNTEVYEETDVNVVANASAKNGASISKVEFYNGDKLVGTDESAPYSFTYKDLTDGTYNISARVYDSNGLQTQSDTSKLHVNSKNSAGDWISTDIGDVAIKGSASMTDGVLTVKGNGKLGREEGSVKGTDNYDASKDSCDYAYQKLTGDGTITAKLDSETVVDCHTFTGLMFRESLASGAKSVNLGFSMVKLSSKTCWATHMTARKESNGNLPELSETLDSVANANKAGIGYVTDLNYKTNGQVNGTWLRLVREGDTFRGYASDDGKDWTLVSEMTVDLLETAYVGFAVDSGQVANSINNLSTAKFSNIELTNEILDKKDNADNNQESGNESQGSESGQTDEKTNMPVVYDNSNLLSMTGVGSSIILSQGAKEGKIATESAASDVNASYLLFPETKDNQKLELDLTINSYSIFGQAGKTSGVFVGAFGSGKNVFATLGFRGYDSTVGSDSLSGYWTKATGKAGNGSPKYEVATGDTYHVVFERTSSGYTATFTDLTNPLIVTSTGETYKDSKTIKLSDLYTGEGNVGVGSNVSLGIGIVGATVKVQNMILTDSKGNVLYNQRDYYKDAGTAPTITKVNTPVINDERTEITVSYEGTGLTGDGMYEISVSTDGGHNFKTVATTKDTSYSYKPSASGNYIFKITGVMGEEVSNSMNSAAVDFVKPLTEPESLNAKSGDSQIELSWKSVSGATGYEVYRKTVDADTYELIGETSSTSYKDMSAVNEVVYNYAVTAKDDNNASNKSGAITIMATAGHTGEYYFGDEAANLELVSKSDDTIVNGKNAGFTIKSSENGSFMVTLNGKEIASKEVKAGENFEVNLDLTDGRNAVVAYFTSESGVKTYKNFNFVSLTNIEKIVDASYTGSDGDLVDGIPTYKTVASAIDSVADTDDNTVIFIKNGRYYEKLNIEKANITLIGEDAAKTVLCYDVASGSVSKDGSTYGTSGSASVTLGAGASGFAAENLTISNEFDYLGSSIDGKQAVALLNNADKTVFTNVILLGYQDTLYANGSSIGARQYYNRCYIEGNVDFIFGRALAAFTDCDIVSNGDGYLTAASTESVNSVGYVFNNCRLLAKSNVKGVYLARPWRTNAAVYYINCYMGKQIREVGYCDMSNNSYKDARYGEYGSYGQGFVVNTDRVQLSKEKADKLSTAAQVLASDPNLYADGAWDVDMAYENISKSYTKTSDKSYKMLSGDNVEIKQGEVLVLRSEADFEKFVGVRIDGELVDSTNYKAYSGSTVIELGSEFTKTLSEGEHTIEILSKDGQAKAIAVVKKGEETSDETTTPRDNEAAGDEATTPRDNETVNEPTAPVIEEVAADTGVVNDSPKNVDANEEMLVAADTVKSGDVLSSTIYLIVMLVSVIGIVTIIFAGEGEDIKKHIH